MLKITITGKRGEGKTTLAHLIQSALLKKNIESTLFLGVKDVIEICDSRKVLMCLQNLKRG